MFLNVNLNVVMFMKGKKVFRLSNRAYIFSALAVVFAVAVIFVSLLFVEKAQTDVFYSPVSHGAIILSGGEDTGKIIPGKGISCVRKSFSADSSAVLMADGSTYTLYHVQDGDFVKLNANCTGEFICSADGKKVVYLNSDDVLFIDKTEIADSVECFASSPDANAVVYVKREENSQSLYLYMKGKSEKVGDGYMPVAVSSDGKNIYVLSSDNSFCILGADGTMKSKLGPSVLADSFVFSEDLSVVIFSDGEYTYMSVDGKSRVRLFAGTGRPHTYMQESLRIDSTGNAEVMNSSLESAFYTSVNEKGNTLLYYVNEESAIKELCSDVKSFSVTDDEIIAYLDTQGSVYSYNGTDAESVASGVDEFYATAKSRYIYYMTTAGDVYSLKNTNNQLLATGVYRFMLHSDDSLYIIMTDRKLYRINGVRRGDVIAENVNFCKSQHNVMYYGADFNPDTGTYSLYASADGGEFNLISEHIAK